MTSSPARTLFLVPSLAGGGAERLLTILVRGLDRTLVDPMLVVLRDDPHAPFREAIPADVPIVSLQKRSALDLPLLVVRLARLFERSRPELAMGFMTYSNLLLLAAARVGGHPPAIIATEHNKPSHAGPAQRRGLRMAAARRLYPRADRVVAVSDGAARELIESQDLARGLVTTIPNPFDPALDDLLNTEQLPHPWLKGSVPTLVAVGRLKPAKGFHLLLEAVAAICHRRPVRLLILGEGPERQRLERLAAELGIEESVQLLGFQPNPYPFMRAADVYVLSSLWEGLPVVMVEAVRAGAAIVAADCDFGPREVIVDGVSGLLVPPADVAALANGITRVLDDPVLADRLRAGARARSEAFSPAAIVGRYAELVTDVVTARRARAA